MKLNCDFLEGSKYKFYFLFYIYYFISYIIINHKMLKSNFTKLRTVNDKQ